MTKQIKEDQGYTIQPCRISVDIGPELWPCVITLKEIGHRAVSDFIREALRAAWEKRGLEMEQKAEIARKARKRASKEAEKIFKRE